MSTTSQKFESFTDLAAERLGGKVLYATDDFFAEKENLIKPGRGIFIADKFTERGKWMDGWESRRKRTPGHDYCIVQLATTGRISGFDIDTNFFLGNHPPNVSIEACYAPGVSDLRILDGEQTKWVEILPKSPLLPGSQNLYAIENQELYTHIKLHIYPDGGVARFRVYGEVFLNWDSIGENEKIDLAAAVNGAKSLICNDMFFSHMDNLIMPGRGVNMGDGWETKRNRTPKNRDWIVVRLGHAGEIETALVDTAHFKGNYPDSCQIEGCFISPEKEAELIANPDSGNWQLILPQTKLQADHEHHYSSELIHRGPFTHVRLTIFPDGGISRLRLVGVKRPNP